MIGAKAFTMDDQLAFARASGDLNPVHVDPEYARRTMYGGVLVHGVNALMWALDRCCAIEGLPGITIRAQFAKPVFLGETVSATRRDEDGSAMIIIASGQTALVTISFAAARKADPSLGEAPAGEWSRAARPLRHSDAEGRRAELPYDPDEGALRAMFPALAREIGDRATGTLALLSRLVGMECPGVDSLFAGLTATVEPKSSRSSFSYRVRRATPAFVPVQMDFSGPDLSGTVAAFFRPAEVVQPAIADLADHVRPGEFASRRALVVGGSRGLGEVTAKLLAAGGADVAITYATGARDAARVQREIQDHGGKCRAYRLDVLDQRDSVQCIAADFGPVDSAYYFATPKITGRRGRAFDPDRLREFEEYYVLAFGQLCASLRRFFPDELSVFFPSTVFIDEPSPENVEYAQAKEAGERAATAFASEKLRVVTRRLPRMATDQTAALMTVQIEDSVAVMLDVIRDVNAAAI